MLTIRFTCSRLPRLLLGAALSGAFLAGASSCTTRPEVEENAAARPTASAVNELALAEGVYGGTVGGREAVWLRIRPQADTLGGEYYTASAGNVVELRGSRMANDYLRLREYQIGGPRTTGEFRVKLVSRDSLVGTWRESGTRPPLPVNLRRYRATAAPDCQARLTDRAYFDAYHVPVVQVADAAVARRLQQRLNIETVSGRRLGELRRNPADTVGKAFRTLNYEVGYQDNCLLSVAFRSAETGASAYQPLTIDLGTGFEVNINDEVAPARRTEFRREAARRLPPGAAAPDVALTGLLIQNGRVRVYQPMGGSFETQQYAEFTVDELKPYLRPDSPLQRL